MGNAILPFVIVMTILFVVTMFLLARQGESSQQRLARVRVRVDENRREPPIENEDEEAISIAIPIVLACGALVLLLIIAGGLP